MNFSPTDVLAPVAGGTSSFVVLYSAGCSSYSAQSAASWITVNGVSAGTVTYTVAANTGAPRDGYINVNYNDGTGPTSKSFLISQNRALVGAPGVSFNTNAFSFGGQATGTTSAAKTVTLTNIGNAALSIGSVAPSIPVFAVSHNCGNTLAAGASCNLSVTLTPAAAGQQLGLITPIGSGCMCVPKNACQGPLLGGVGKQITPGRQGLVAIFERSA
jgi:hypothetical protein